jgi:hypothetical protein
VSHENAIAQYAYTTILLIICCAVHTGSASRIRKGALLALASVALWVLGSYALGLGSLGNLLVQVGLFFALTFWNMRRREPGE